MISNRSNEIDKEERPGDFTDDLSGVLKEATCPACGHHIAVSFFNPGPQTLATLAWPRTSEEAKTMVKLPHDFVRCVDCGHVYNCQFDYAVVPYCDKPNLMFNRGAVWSEHLQSVRDLILEILPENPTVVEIGCGEGHLLRSLAQNHPAGNYIGFDPNAEVETAGGLFHARTELFDPAVHLQELKPDLIVSRHVFEHLVNPLGFVQKVAFAASWVNLSTRLFLEVPCIDPVLENPRTVDFFYEHNSHFTTTSLRRMLQRCASKVVMVETSFNREVVYGLADFVPQPHQAKMARDSIAFQKTTTAQHDSLATQFEALLAHRKKIAIWGGTGKAAAFIQQNELDAKRFPTVVDSDPAKAGTHVPGTGQPIRYRDVLKTEPAEIVVIATHWRSPDIVAEILAEEISCEQILIEYRGKLVDYFTGDHPYRIEGTKRSKIARPHFLAIKETSHSRIDR